MNYRPLFALPTSPSRFTILGHLSYAQAFLRLFLRPVPRCRSPFSCPPTLFGDPECGFYCRPRSTRPNEFPRFPLLGSSSFPTITLEVRQYSPLLSSFPTSLAFSFVSCTQFCFQDIPPSGFGSWPNRSLFTVPYSSFFYFLLCSITPRCEVRCPFFS